MPPAIIAAAVVGTAAVGSAAISSSAAKKASKAATQAADQNTAAAERTRDIITNQVQPWVQPGGAATNRLAERLGLTVGQPTAAPAPANPLVAYSTGGAAKTPGGFAGTSPVELGDPRTSVIGAQGFGGAEPGTAIGGPGVVGSAAPDFAAYGAANPDLQQEWAKIQATGNADRFNNDPNAYYAWHYQTHGQDEGRQLPTSGQPAQQAAPGGNPLATAAQGAPPNGTGADYGRPTGLTAPTFGPRDTTARPDIGAAPSYDFSANAFEASPDYAFRQKEAARALNNYYGAKGVIGSGGAIRAILDRASNLASGEFGNWFQRQLQRQEADRGQYNTDASRSDTNFNVDRSVGDARYDADRGFQYGDYIDKLNYGTGRFDTENNDLFRLSGQGLAGVGAIAGANQNALGVIAGSNNQRADAIGGAAISNANTVSNLAGQGLSALGTYYGLRNTGQGGSLSATNPLRSI